MNNYIWNKQGKNLYLYQVSDNEMDCRAVLSENYGKWSVTIEFGRQENTEQLQMTALELILYLDGKVPLHRLRYRGYPVKVDEE
ncbi:MAG: hypothetical protein JKX75_06410 [Gammaproteobacteria bacterium]|nr:hypothetical protein [Gammaproteobacteria bacterium]